MNQERSRRWRVSLRRRRSPPNRYTLTALRRFCIARIAAPGHGQDTRLANAGSGLNKADGAAGGMAPLLLLLPLLLLQFVRSQAEASQSPRHVLQGQRSLPAGEFYCYICQFKSPYSAPLREAGRYKRPGRRPVLRTPGAAPPCPPPSPDHTRSESHM